MASHGGAGQTVPAGSAEGRHFLIVEARYYEALADALLAGARAVFDAAGAKVTVVTVPGALEIPAAIALAEAGSQRFDGYVALGCVIRGETTHYEIVSNESARALMDLSIQLRLALGNGILTVENEAQAWDRAAVDRQDKGGGAARAALVMAALKSQMEA
ncbi:6,7-dimethyl-8-ribityllumazine synthase [Devosia enhydra]|uniref:6,7-dimethyl-8-ribityllumazine synthase n=1 Tax=Devosia enhydra TaxID=665118 RepID=A0A1K2HTB1_9HYPH|nr:6,7-dimethyl-8-ribityllumazine synthase [Devosia enhydra]SFZ81347.1 6,7-dimethyl-8-ribityllumazine synthase [Devosia enhydra]